MTSIYNATLPPELILLSFMEERQKEGVIWDQWIKGDFEAFVLAHNAQCRE